MLAPSCAARVPALAGWAGPIQSPGCARLHSSAGIAVSQRPSTLSSPGPTRGNLQPIRQGGARHLLPQDLIQGGEARLQLAQQAPLATLLCLECFMARHTGLPRRIGFLMAGAGEREFRRQASRAGCRFSPPRQGARPVRLPA